MAVDDALLEFATEHQAAVLRIYRWSNPTVSLGYFQLIKDRAEHAPSRSLELVRRSTGGGAIVHHHDWTYSIALPASSTSNNVGAAQPLYDCVHDGVVDWLVSQGWPARKWAEVDARSAECNTKGCPFLCFERRSLGDVVIGGAKVMGSAQRRSRGGLLQHGSLLLRCSEFAPSLAGLADIDLRDSQAPAGSPDLEVFCRVLRERLSDFLGAAAAPIRALNELIQQEIHTGRYASESWTHKR